MEEKTESIVDSDKKIRLGTWNGNLFSGSLVLLKDGRSLCQQRFLSFHGFRVVHMDQTMTETRHEESAL